MDDLILIPGRISEMAKNVEDFGVNVPITGIDIDALTEGDNDPMFITIEALNEGVSANKVNYSREVIMEIAAKVNELKPDGYMGHIDDKDIQTKNPRSETIWLGATTAEVNGKLRMFIKGYVMPYAKDLKTYIKKAKAVKKSIAVSIFGAAQKTIDAINKVYNIVPNTFKLQSIDWARSAGAGVMTLGAFSVTKEMAATSELHLQPREEIIKSISVDELKMNNTLVIKEMKDSFIVELEPVLRKQIETEAEGKIAEMQGTIEDLNKKIAVGHLDTLIVGLPDNAKGLVKKMVIAEMQSTDYTEERVKELYTQFINGKDGLLIKEMIQGIDINPIMTEPQTKSKLAKGVVSKKKTS